MTSAEVAPPPPARHLISAGGLAALKARLATAPERDKTRLSQLIAAAEVAPAPKSCERVAFGHRVTTLDDQERRHVFTLVGEHEAEPANGRISWRSPLGQALIGAGVGDLVHWARPAGAVELEITEIDHDD